MKKIVVGLLISLSSMAHIKIPETCSRIYKNTVGGKFELEVMTDSKGKSTSQIKYFSQKDQKYTILQGPIHLTNIPPLFSTILDAEDYGGQYTGINNLNEHCTIYVQIEKHSGKKILTFRMASRKGKPVRSIAINHDKFKTQIN